MTTHLVLVLILASSTATAQENLCSPAKVSTVDQASGIVVKKVALSGSWGTNTATVFLPDKEIADGAALFSHSMIQSDNGTSADLIPVALTLARAGAAVIGPERTMLWPPKDEWTNREGGVVICAAQWLRENVKLPNDGKQVTNKDNIVIRVGYAYVGPHICDPTSTSECQLTSPFAWPSQPNGVKVDAAYVPVGEPGNGEMMRFGGVPDTRSIARWLGLSQIRPLVRDSHRDNPSQAR